jgi:acetyltransferase-like isoleucine patch superfamily enzyme
MSREPVAHHLIAPLRETRSQCLHFADCKSFTCDIGDETRLPHSLKFRKESVESPLGENAVVDTGSVVTRDVSQNMTAPENPARILEFAYAKSNAY